jgi:hypothetical protein
LRRPKDSVLLEQIINDGLLLSVDPTGEQQQEEGKRRRQRIHRDSVPETLRLFKDDIDSAEFRKDTPSSGCVDPPIIADFTSAEFPHRTGLTDQPEQLQNRPRSINCGRQALLWK